MGEVGTLSVVTLNQFVLDFTGNLKRIVESVVQAKKDGSRFRIGPELDICGYSCQDHFYENDTLLHCWQVLGTLLTHEDCQDILIDVGMPVCHRGVTYNCRVIFLNRKIYLIRAKMHLANDFNYRESRWFTPWQKPSCTEPHQLPELIKAITGQTHVPFGDALLTLSDTVIGFEICEELWTPDSFHVAQALAGAEIIVNSSGSHAEIRKAFYQLDLMKTASAKTCTLYAFANLRGCDGERYYLNGISAIAMNGNFLKVGEQYSLLDVEVLTTRFSLTEIRNLRATFRSRCSSASKAPEYESITVPWKICGPVAFKMPLSPVLTPSLICAEEEIARGPALWCWDYLRRSPAAGFFLPLSGGVDSTSVAIIIYSMCNLIVDHVLADESSSKTVLKDLKKVLRDTDFVVTDAKALCAKLLHTCYMKSDNSSIETEERAKNLANAIGSNHRSLNISGVCAAFEEETTKCLDGKRPSFSGTRQENLALQNIQARSRMAFAYMMAQLAQWANGQNGFLLVLGTANVDEALCGYFTKYDCSAADLNPIGGISKIDLKSFILYSKEKFNLPEINEIVEAPPTAELQPLEANQSDEADLGLTYKELSVLGKLRRPLGFGPFSMFVHLLHSWSNEKNPLEIANKVKHFYVKYASNRHKMSILTPACHMENYSPEDHRHDLRPLFYPTDFSWQFKCIDELLKEVD